MHEHVGDCRHVAVVDHRRRTFFHGDEVRVISDNAYAMKWTTSEMSLWLHDKCSFDRSRRSDRMSSKNKELALQTSATASNSPTVSLKSRP